MIRDIDVSLLRAFLAVVETGSVTAAARLLNRTQAAVSLQIKRLEETIGQSLFERQHRRLAIAAAGERLIATAERMVAANDEIWSAMTTPAFEGEVRFGVPIDIVPTYTPPILRRFHQRWPRVQVRIVVKNSVELLEDLAEALVDVVLTTDQHRAPHAETLHKDQLVWVGAVDGRAHLARPLPLSMGGKSCRFRPVVLEALRDAGIDWRVVLEYTNQEAVNATISAGIAVGALLRDSIPETAVVLGPSDGLPPLPEFLINLQLQATGGSEVAREFARHVRAEFVQRYGTYEDGVSARSGERRVVASPVRARATKRVAGATRLSRPRTTPRSGAG